MRNLKGSNLNWVSWLFLLLLVSLPIQARSNEVVHLPLVYLQFRDAVAGLQQPEAEKLKDIFTKFKVLDLEASHLTDLQNWLSAVNERLTLAVEKRGTSYPAYRIYVIASSEATAFVYKFNPAGHKTYQGHVFLSSGLVEKFLKNAGQDIDHLNKTELDRLLNGLIGVMAHEFVHPKQDEMVKWQWREAQGNSRQNHGQVDELSTDMMAVEVLKDAELETNSLLTGLRLLYGDTAPRGSFVSRAANSGISSHPEEDLRLNIMRGALSKLRLTEGKTTIRPVTYPESGLKEDLKRLLLSSQLENQLEIELTSTGASPYSNATRSFLKWISDPRVGGHNGESKKILAYFDLIRRLGEGKNLTKEEINDFEILLEYLLGPGRKKFGSDTWFLWSGGSGQGVFEGKVSPEEARQFQRLLEKMDVFRDMRFTRWLNSKLKQDFFSTFSYGGSSFEFIAAVLPRVWLEKIVTQGLGEVESKDSAVAMRYLLTMQYCSETAGLTVQTQTKIRKKIFNLIANDEVAIKTYIAEGPNVDDSKVSEFEYLKERFIQEAASKPKETEKLLKVSGDFFGAFFEYPNVYPVLERLKKESFPLFIWSHDPETRYKKLHANIPMSAPNSYAEINRILSNPEWQKLVEEALQKPELYRNGSAAAMLAARLGKPEMPFTEEQRIQLILKLCKLEHGTLGRENFALFSKLRVGNFDRSLSVAISTRFLETYAEANHQSLDQVFRELKWFTEAYQVQGTPFLAFAYQLKAAGKIENSTYQAALTQALWIADGTNINYLLGQAARRDLYDLLNAERDAGVKGSVFVKKVIEQFELSRLNTLDDNGQSVQQKALIAQEAGLKILPEYSAVLGKISGGLLSEFLDEFGLSRNLTGAEYALQFSNHFEGILKYFTLMFNPDQIPVPMHLKSQANYDGLSKLASEFVATIPAVGLTDEQYFKLWANISAKKSNRYSDTFFKRHIYQTRAKLSTAQVKEILENGMIQSEMMKIDLFAQMNAGIYQSLTQKKGEVSETELRKLTDELNRYAPDASAFKDQYLEKLAWGLELNERALYKFIEPMKSFNYKAIDPGTLNVLSVLSVMIEKLSAPEKIDFLKYILDPKGDLLSAIPVLGRSITDISNQLTKQTGEYVPTEKVMEMITKLETFIVDAGESQRLILNEMMIGTRKPHGLWFSGQKNLEQLYTLAGLDAEKLKLFKAYSAALPEYEQTVMLSYLLASRPSMSNDDSQLLRILELHNTAGIKFAQMASILNIFGPEESNSLAKAKDASAPPTRAEIFERLHQVCNAQQFAEIKSVKSLAGSGGIKHVVFVEYQDGSTEAVYLKRKSLQGTIDSTLDTVEAFANNLKALPEYKDAYDYDYYLSSLRKQLGEETQFLREMNFSKTMGEKYAAVSSHQGWSFEAVKASELRAQTESVLHFRAVKGTVSFSKLSEIDKKIVSELILNTELEFLLKDGVFDADRHLGNFLFDPTTKKIYPIDFSQVYSLSPNGFFKPGDPHHLAQIFYGISDADSNRGAARLTQSFLSIAESKPNDPELAKRLQQRIGDTLSSPEVGMRKMLKLISVLTEEHVYLPQLYTLGIVKGLSILANEQYAALVAPDFIQSRIKSFVKKEVVLGARFKIFGNESASCDRLMGGTSEK